MPQVSVVVPLYNKEPYVRRALDSIAAQSFADFEVVIVDDGSQDGSAAIAAGYPDSRFRMIRQANAGPGAARNRGIAEAQGEWIAFLDADDEWLPDYLELAVRQFRSLGEDVASVSSGYYDFHGPGTTPRSTKSMWEARGIVAGSLRVHPGMETTAFAYALAYLHPCTTVIRASVLRKWGGFYEERCRFAEDSFLMVQLLLNETVVFEMTPRVIIHTEAGQLSKNQQSARPVEPFLEHPERIEHVCPVALRPLLARFFTFRAFKTACVLGYWGQWEAAKRLRTRFRTADDRGLPLYWASWVCTTPLARPLGALLRRIRPLHP